MLTAKQCRNKANKNFVFIKYFLSDELILSIRKVFEFAVIQLLWFSD